MRKARIWAVAVVAMFGLGSLAIASPASASGGGCPSSYTQVFSYKEMVKIQKSLGNKDATTDPLVAIDKNGDGSLCYTTLPQGANDPYIPVNVIDNNAR
jgi:hypothetical protein